jgi:hypothetical protein
VRLLLSAVAIILFFALGVWAIALLLPQNPDWLKLALAMLWLVSLRYWGILVEKTTDCEWGTIRGCYVGELGESQDRMGELCEY